MKIPWFMTATVYGTLGLCLALGVFLFGMGVRNIWRGHASAAWPTAPAVVVASDLTVSRSSDGSSTTGAEIVAKYVVNGREYTTDTRRFGQTLGSGDKSVAELQQLRYPAGSAISVSYDPSSPDVSTMEPGFDTDALWLPGAGLAFIAVAVLFAVLYRGSESNSGMGLGIRIFAVVFMGIGTPMLVAGGVNLYRAYVSSSWPTAKGEIVYDDVEVSSVVSRDDAKKRTRSTTTYGARMVFRYKVNGKVHYSNTRRFGALAGSDADWAYAIADRYPAGIKLDVHYNPSDPDLAILEPGIDSEAYWLPGAGLAFFLFGLAAMVFAAPALSRF